jgi:class 3 adenylate cyclase/tetratricopeptide (TPR) repeat protein
VQCSSCGAQAPEGHRFCGACGLPLGRACPSCGTAADPDQRFCGVCGTPLERAAPGPAPVPSGPALAGTEMRMVSVLFVDLVGFTTLTESRDAEDVRDLLSRYFETARTIVGRYGGTIEKFIGDAVMAVWGAPMAREDDAERAVRAGLDLIDAVAAFGAEAGAEELRARGGVVTGRAAALDSSAEGIVTGDSVNTAARIQGIAQPGMLCVDDVTRQVTSSAIAYADAGEHTLKGKAEPVHVWRAERVVATVAGAMRTGGVEAAFVGRELELRLVKELFHSVLDRGAARLVTVSGSAGVGKSRLGWEFEKYIDGIANVVLWHRGRCLSYGDGVAYWALAEMVRGRFKITEDQSPPEAAQLLEDGLERWIAEPAERGYIAARLGALLGLGDPGLGREELFAGWRLFIERLAEHSPVLLVFEDLQWADAGLLDFLEHLIEWSAEKPIFILTFARPELAERREGWASGRRGATPIYLEPLGDAAMGELLHSLVDDLPEAARDRIVQQAQGIPLYAIETVRALADRGVLTEHEGRLRRTGDVGELDVPASLSSLLAARLDGLEPDERELVKALSVFGGTFSRSAAAALADVAEERLDDVLAALVRKEVLAIRADPLSPDRGQYAFSQTLLRTVAYDMLSRRERKPRHVAAAIHMRATFADDGEEVAEVIASHYLDAYRAAPDDPDADELRSEAVAALGRAGQRAAGVGAPDVAERAYRDAAELTADERERVDLIVAAGRMALRSGSYEVAVELFDEAAAAHRSAGREEDAARLVAGGSEALRQLKRLEDSIVRLREALAVLGADALDPDVGELNAELGIALLFAGRLDEAREPLEAALRIAESLGLEHVLCRALISKATLYTFTSRWREADALLEAAVTMARDIGAVDQLQRALTNLGNLRMLMDLPGARGPVEEGVTLARRVGDRGAESLGAGNLSYVLLNYGEWDEIDRLDTQLNATGADEPRPLGQYFHERLVELHALRGDAARARAHLEGMASWQDAEDHDLRGAYASASGLVALVAGDAGEALGILGPLARDGCREYGNGENLRQAWTYGVEAAFAHGRIEEVDELIELLEAVPPGTVAPYLRAQIERARAGACALRRDVQAETHALAAIDSFAALGYSYWLARSRIELGEWLIGQGRETEAEPHLAAALPVLEALRAEPLLARARDLPVAAVASSPG